MTDSEENQKSTSRVAQGGSEQTIAVPGASLPFLQKLPPALQSLLRALTSAAIVTQTDPQGIVLFVNDQFTEVSQYKRNEIIGRKHSIIKSGVHPREFFEDMWNNYLLKGNIWRGEIENRAKDGTPYWVSATIVPFFDTTGTILGFVSIQFVVTAKKTAEEFINKEQSYYREIAEHAADLISVLDKDGAVSYLSPSFVNLIGKPLSDLLGKRLFDIIHTNDTSRLEKEFATAVKNPGASHTLEFRIQKSDGTWRTIEAAGKNLLDNPAVHGIVCNCRDITEQKEAEQKLRMRTEELEKLNRYFMDRELRMVELKEEIERLKGRA